MPLIKDIQEALPFLAELPEEWQKNVALAITNIMVAYDNTLTMTPAEQRELRDKDISAALKRVKSA
jgi:hypothetical protein